jgi:hypothetical protein
MLTGRYPRNSVARNNGAFKLAPKTEPPNPYSLPGLFLKNGYTTVSLGKISHSPAVCMAPRKKVLAMRMCPMEKSNCHIRGAVSGDRRASGAA